MSHAKQLHHRRSLNNDLEIINRHGLPGNIKTRCATKMQQAVTATCKGVLEHSLEEALTQYLGFARYEHLP